MGFGQIFIFLRYTRRFLRDLFINLLNYTNYETMRKEEEKRTMPCGVCVIYFFFMFCIHAFEKSKNKQRKLPKPHFIYFLIMKQCGRKKKKEQCPVVFA